MQIKRLSSLWKGRRGGISGSSFQNAELICSQEIGKLSEKGVGKRKTPISAVGIEDAGSGSFPHPGMAINELKIEGNLW
jgi:hypothetical protein